MSKQSENAARREQALTEKRNVTSKISETCRYIGFGLLAIYYAVLIGDASGLGLVGWPLRIIGLCGAVTIALDYLQYLLGAWSVEQALARDDAMYPQSLAHTGRRWCFYLKQVTAGVGAIALIASIAFASSQSAAPSA